MRKMRKCAGCGRYTLREECHASTKSAHPPKFSFQDRFAKFRRAIVFSAGKPQGGFTDLQRSCMVAPERDRRGN